MAVIKQRFKLRKKRLSVALIIIISILIIGSGLLGFWLSDSGTINKALNRTSIECKEIYNTMQDFMKESNYWRNENQECEKKLWTCGLLLKQASAKSSEVLSENSSQ